MLSAGRKLSHKGDIPRSRNVVFNGLRQSRHRLEPVVAPVEIAEVGALAVSMEIDPFTKVTATASPAASSPDRRIVFSRQFHYNPQQQSWLMPVKPVNAEKFRLACLHAPH